MFSSSIFFVTISPLFNYLHFRFSCLFSSLLSFSFDCPVKPKAGEIPGMHAKAFLGRSIPRMQDSSPPTRKPFRRNVMGHRPLSAHGANRAANQPLLCRSDGAPSPWAWRRRSCRYVSSLRSALPPPPSLLFPFPLASSPLRRHGKGDNENLRLILFAPGSKFENDTIWTYKNNLPISIHAEDDITIEQPDKPSAGNKRRGNGAGPKGTVSRTRSLGSGWFLDFDSLTSIATQFQAAAAAELEGMYDSIAQLAARQLGMPGEAAAARRRIGFSYGAYKLRLESQEPIAWTWIVNFAEAMREGVGSRGAGLFGGEAYSYYWEIAAVGAALSVV